jgi:methionyl-tRNA formyltransferase
MRLLMVGTGPFAVPTLEALYESSHEVVALVTQPPRSSGGRRRAAENPMRLVAEQHGTPVLMPEAINDEASRAELAALEPELMVVADYGQILSAETLAIAPRGGMNVHGSLLPAYRGAAPINWAIYDGCTETGVTLIHMTPRVDAGPCMAQSSTPIDPEEDAPELETRLARLGAELAVHEVDRLAARRLTIIAQDPQQATGARRLRKTDGVIDFSRTAQQIKNQVRALKPWPRAFTFWHRGDAPPLRFTLDRVDALEESSTATPGTVVRSQGDSWHVATGQGTLALLVVQPAGKKPQSAEAFLRGYPVAEGDRLGPE